MSEQINYITPLGFEKLRTEYLALLNDERPKVVVTVTWAASNGDRSENADYQYGKKRLREIDRRVRFLTQRLDASLVVDPASINSTKVQFGATLQVLDDEGKSKTYSIVGVDEVDTAKGRISWQSPIGKSLIGKTIGDEVLVKIPAGEVTLEIVKINYHPIE